MKNMDSYYKHKAIGAYVSFVAMFSLFVFPHYVNAGLLSFLGNALGTETEAAEIQTDSSNSQTVALLSPSLTIDLKNTSDSATVNIIGDNALEPNIGPSGNEGKVLEMYASLPEISIYTVKKGDTLESIAKKFKISTASLIYANGDIPRNELTNEGQVVVIMPIKLSYYTVKKGDTIGGIAKKYGVEAQEIVDFNENVSSSQDLKFGQKILIPGIDQVDLDKKGGSSKKSTSISSKPNSAPKTTAKYGTSSLGKTINGYIWPFPAGQGRVSQGVHDGQAYDFAAPKGTPIYSIANGRVTITKNGGYNGGYGSYVVVRFDNGAQAIFAHMSKVASKPGDVVKQGDVIGYVGSTGRSTGPHVHIEFRGGYANPYRGLPKNSRGL
jgi:murein DD-endopeptidase MepM/ murein hydrolase activator NlpD